MIGCFVTGTETGVGKTLVAASLLQALAPCLPRPARRPRPRGWIEHRIEQHRKIRDDVLAALRDVEGIAVRTPQAGSYLLPRLPRMGTAMGDFVRILREQASVTVTPGTEFSPDATDSIRLNFSQNRLHTVDAVKRMATLVDRYHR